MSKATKQPKPATVHVVDTGHHIVELPQGAFARVLRAVVAAMDDGDSARYALAVVRIEVDRGTITFVATDGKRLAYVTYPTTYDDLPFTFHLPRKQALELSRIYSQRPNDVIEITIQTSAYGNERHTVRYTDGRRKPQLRQFEYDPTGRFPKWRNVVNEASDNRVNHVGTMSGTCEALAKAFEPRRGLMF